MNPIPHRGRKKFAPAGPPDRRFPILNPTHTTAMLLDTQHVDPPTSAIASPARPMPVRTHTDLREDEFWRGIPGYAQVSAAEFESHSFQQKHAVTNVRQLQETLGALVPKSFYEDLAAGIRHAPMALRISPYLLALVNWREPLADPIRTQFLPLHSQQLPDHPMVRLEIGRAHV